MAKKQGAAEVVEKEWSNEGSGKVHAVSAIATNIWSSIDRVVDVADALHKLVEEGTGTFARVDSLTKGYGALNEAASNLGDLIDLDKVAQLEVTLHEVKARIQKREGING